MRFAKRLSDVCESTQHVCELKVGETTDIRADTRTTSERKGNLNVSSLLLFSANSIISLHLWKLVDRILGFGVSQLEFLCKIFLVIFTLFRF